ncbi:hypothetical protein Aduo_000261 [Ancylostoma duodenale]
MAEPTNDTEMQNSPANATLEEPVIEKEMDCLAAKKKKVGRKSRGAPYSESTESETDREMDVTKELAKPIAMLWARLYSVEVASYAHTKLKQRQATPIGHRFVGTE